MVELDKELIEICADAFMATWTAVRTTQSLVYDTLEYVLENQEIVDDVWNVIKRKYAACENPFGVFSFPTDKTMQVRDLVITRCTDHRYPKLVELFKVRFQSESFA